LIQPNDKIALVAKTKSGKSYLGKILQRAAPRKIIVDTTYEYDASMGLIVYGFDQFCQAVQNMCDLDSYTIIFRFAHEDSNREQVFEEICRIVFYVQDVFFVVEEIHLHSTTHSLNHWLLQIATIGSHRNIGYLITTQRPSLLHKTLLTQCDHIFIGSLIDENDISYVKGFCRDLAKSLYNYPPRKFIYWNLGTITQISTENLK
jgi:hypothetical protein